MNHFVDLKEFKESPVKSVLENYSFRLLPDKIQKVFFQIKKHEFSTFDSWFGTGSKKT